MARAAKKETPLTIEEKLAKALVPEEEQPYPVPENWCWVRLGSLYEINPKNEANDELEAGFVPMDKISAGMCTSFNFDVQPWVKAKKGHVQFADGDVAFAKISPCFENRKSMIVGGLPNGIGAGTTEIIVLRQPSVNNRFTFWLISTDDFIQKGRRTYSGTVGQQRISMDYVRQYPIPLPPLSEQQRIVTLIESLFADLDAAKKKLQAVLDGFAQRRAALLHQAFTGELTREWREEQGVGVESWNEKTLQDVCKTKITDGTHKTPTYSTKEEGGVPFISSKDVTQEKICWDNIKYIVPELHEELYSRLAPQRDDVLLAKNGTTGIAAIVDTDIVFDVYVTLAVLRPNKDIIHPRFLLHVVNSPLCKRQFDEHLTGIGLPNLHLRDIKEVIINVPSISEQKEIVRILDDFFAKESQSKAAVESALAKIDTMKKAILATAFRGGFRTNDISDESAKELLRRVL